MRFEVVHGISAKAPTSYDDPGADRTGFRPCDDAEDVAAPLGHDAMAEDPVDAGFRGGPFRSDELETPLGCVVD